MPQIAMKTKIPHLQLRLIILCFLQFASWGAWLITLGRYLGNTLHFDEEQIGLAFATAGLASLFMPALLGYLADRFFRAERVLAFALIACGAFLVAFGLLPSSSPAWLVLLLILGVNLFFMPTLSLYNSVAYSSLAQNGEDVVKVFPPIRVWGTIGFIAAMWLVNLLGLMESPKQFFLAGGLAIAGGLYSLSMPACPPQGKGQKSKGLLSILGLDALVIFKDRKMALFLLFAMLLGCALQLTNAYGNLYLSSFGDNPEFASSFAVKNSNILLSISQISETLFILTIPFFLKRWGIKWVIFASLMAWTLRFALLGLGDPGFPGIIALVLSMIVYGMAFDFFNISGSIYVEREVAPAMRAGAQGVFVLMTNGIGTIIGSIAGGRVVKALNVQQNPENWPTVWYIFALYALVVAVLFLLFFRDKETERSAMVE